MNAPSPRSSAKGRARAKAPAAKTAPLLDDAALVDIAQRVLRARIRLSLQQPFLASAVMRLPVRSAPGAVWCPTAATDGYHIFYNPHWVSTLTESELRGLLAHEVLHVIFTHADRRHEREPHLWNIACDYAINHLLIARGFRLPTGGLVSAGVAGKTSEQLYEELANSRLRIAMAQRPPGFKPRAGQGGPSEPFDDDNDEIPEVGEDLLDPDDPRVRPLRSADAPDREQMAELRRELRQEALSRLEGEGAGHFRSECEADEDSRLDWRGLLREHLSERIKGDWSSFPFSKRLIHRGLFMPSPGMQVPGHVVFAIDTSGSMTISLLQHIAGELRAFREIFPCRLTVLQCDAALQSVEQYEAMDGYEVPEQTSFRGRGGTDFNPVFAWVEQQADVALVVYATDGDGSFPAVPPAAPVIWLHTPPHSSSKRFPFGVVVKVTPPIAPAAPAPPGRWLPGPPAAGHG